MQPLPGNQRPDLLTSLMNMSLVLCLPRKMHLCRSSANVPRLPSFLEMLQHFFDISTSKSALISSVFNTFDFEMCFVPQRRALFRHLNFQKWSESVCFGHFDLEMCFEPQRRALLRHLNFQTRSENEVLCTCWLPNVLRATTACILSTSQLPKVVRRWCFGHVDLEMCFVPQRPSSPQIIGKTVFRVFPTFSRTCIFFLLTVSLLSASSPSLLFICPYCRKFDF